MRKVLGEMFNECEDLRERMGSLCPRTAPGFVLKHPSERAKGRANLHHLHLPGTERWGAWIKRSVIDSGCHCCSSSSVCQCLHTWLTLLCTNALPGLNANISCILSGLRALSRHPECRFRVLRVSDMFSHMPCMELVRCVLSILPQLHTLSVSFDLKNQLEGSRPEANPSCDKAEIPGRNHHSE